MAETPGDSGIVGDDGDHEFKLAMEAAGVGAWRWDVATGRLHLSDAAQGLIGLTESRATYSAFLQARGFDRVGTEIAPLGPFYYAEGYHQQYLAKNPNGYRCHAATGLDFPR